MIEHSHATERVFLSAEWRDLAMLNYEITPELLTPCVPSATELDSFNGKTFISLVGFRFLRTKLFGFLPLPFHANFDEVNLRFYVRRQVGATFRRGVVFIREIVPRRAIAQVARVFYGENYTSHPMRHSITRNATGLSTEYQWRFNDEWCCLCAEASGVPAHPSEGSLEQFITEHYWGYTARPGRDSIEYHVTHIPWRVWTATTACFDGDGDALYGRGFGEILKRKPDTAFIVEGSPVTVSTGQHIR
ncbi:MAG: YqjF family protein [Candidatus Acidiferrales bacterium]